METICTTRRTPFTCARSRARALFPSRTNRGAIPSAHNKEERANRSFAVASPYFWDSPALIVASVPLARPTTSRRAFCHVVENLRIIPAHQVDRPKHVGVSVAAPRDNVLLRRFTCLARGQLLYLLDSCQAKENHLRDTLIMGTLVYRITDAGLLFISVPRFCLTCGFEPASAKWPNILIAFVHRARNWTKRQISKVDF